jgi:hypothetical protein
MNSIVSRTCIVLTCWSVFGLTWADEIRQIATISDKRIDESSGIAVSRIHKDCLWLHNDSGDRPRLFLVGRDGMTRATVDVKKADAVDWEDMCSFEIDGQSWLLIADVGDNERNRDTKRPKCRLYFIREPQLTADQDSANVDVSVEVSVTYQDGPQNCESVAVDTKRREILLLSKSQPLDCRLYRLPLDLVDKKQKAVARSIAAVPVPLATGMDISPDGRRLAIITMWTGLLVDRQPEESWADAVRHTGTALQLPQRKQGETVCFDQQGTSLFLNSEKKDQPLWQLMLSDPGN